MTSHTDKTFDLIVEGDLLPDYSAPPPKLHLKNLVWNGNSPPDVVITGDVLLYKIGRYAAPGDQYRYGIASVAKLINGKLEQS